MPLEGISAETDPHPAVPPHVVSGLGAEGIDVHDYQPRRVRQDELATAWRVIAFGCELTDLAPPGLRVERWDDVPPVSEGFARAREAILRRLEPFLDDCGFPLVTPKDAEAAP